jgi:phosphoglycolate phosphatase
MSIDAIIFDLDGTLLDSIGDIAACGNEALASLGFPSLTVDEFRIHVGDGMVGLARKVLPNGNRDEATVAKFLEIYRALYSRKWNQTTVPYDGIEDLLEKLRARGIRLAVLSNKRDEFTKVCVDRLLPAGIFQEVRGESEITPQKPDPQGALRVAESLGVEPQRCLFVGDSEIDAETARRAGMEFVAVEWGYRSRTELEKAGAKKLVSAPNQLLEYV